MIANNRKHRPTILVGCLVVAWLLGFLVGCFTCGHLGWLFGWPWDFATVPGSAPCPAPWGRAGREGQTTASPSEDLAREHRPWKSDGGGHLQGTLVATSDDAIRLMLKELWL